MSKVFGIVGAFVVAVCLVLASMNFARLQSRVDAPSLGEMTCYVGIPALVAIGVCVALAIHFVPMIPTGRPAQKPAPAVPVDEVKNHVPDPSPEPVHLFDPEHNRSRIWFIIDELSEALRDDDEGSEALFVVRERFHRIQFAPTPSAKDEPEQTPAPKPQGKPAPA